MPNGKQKLVVISGGPGAGKSTLIRALGLMGHATAPEAGRNIIKAQTAIGGTALPGVDPQLFAELMLAWDMRSHAEADTAGTTFFDRGVPDTIGYLRLIGLPVPAHMDAAARLCRYHCRVVMLPPWRGIYEQDSERRQDFDEAVATYDSLCSTYADLGYTILNAPRVSVAERTAWIGELLNAEA